MIERKITSQLQQYLAQFPAVTLLGPRQVGKTTLAKKLGAKTESIYLDLENPQDIERLEDPQGYLLQHRGKLVILGVIKSDATC